MNNCYNTVKARIEELEIEILRKKSEYDAKPSAALDRVIKAKTKALNSNISLYNVLTSPIIEQNYLH